MSYPQSYAAFRPGKPGAVWDANVGAWSEPNAGECELAMGYLQGSTAAYNVTEIQRRAVMGRCMDMNVMQSILAIAFAWFRHIHWAPAAASAIVQISALALPSLRNQGIATCLTVGRTTHSVYQGYVNNVDLQGSAEAAGAAEAKSIPDIWEDPQVMYYLTEQQYQPGTSNQERTRVRKRAAFYKLAVGGRLLRQLPNQTTKEVLKPENRQEVITTLIEWQLAFLLKRPRSWVEKLRIECACGLSAPA